MAREAQQQEEEEVEMEEERYRAVILCGRSGSGKSCLASKIVAKLGRKKVILVNSPPSDFGDATVESVQWEAVPLASQERQLAYVLEDVQRLSKDKLERALTLFNVVARHLDCNCLLVCHSLLNTGVYALLNYATELILTSDKVNGRVLRRVLKEYCYGDSEQVFSAFEGLEKWQYLVLRLNERSWTTVDGQMKELRRVDDDDDEKGEGRSPAGKTEVLRYLENCKPGTRVLAEFILDNLPKDSIRKPDMHIRVEDREGNFLTISFIDYVYTLDADDGRRIDPEILALHRLLCKDICFPKRMVRNKKMLAAT